MKILIDFNSLFQNRLKNKPLSSGILNYKLIEDLNTIHTEHELILHVCLDDFSYSDLNSFLESNILLYLFSNIEVYSNNYDYHISDKTITSEQLTRAIHKYGEYSSSSIAEFFDEEIAHSQSVI